jgi:hypothetical protein
MHVTDDQSEAAVQAMSGPERLTGRGRMDGIPAIGGRTGAEVPGDVAGVA